MDSALPPPNRIGGSGFSLFLAAALAVIFWLATAVFMAAVAATSQAVIVHRVSVAAVGA